MEKTTGSAGNYSSSLRTASGASRKQWGGSSNHGEDYGIGW
ncbi:MAG TPA: hypothetical protein VI461_02730 [Chitinophagaceae bacterium]|nr:hypothetical protein [Chitinophagaceae bacterium]